MQTSYMSDFAQLALGEERDLSAAGKAGAENAATMKRQGGSTQAGQVVRCGQRCANRMACKVIASLFLMLRQNKAPAAYAKKSLPVAGAETKPLDSLSQRVKKGGFAGPTASFGTGCFPAMRAGGYGRRINRAVCSVIIHKSRFKLVLHVDKPELRG